MGAMRSKEEGEKRWNDSECVGLKICAANSADPVADLKLGLWMKCLQWP